MPAEFDNRIARLEGLLDVPTAEDALREAEEWLAQGEVRFARLALIRAKSIQARTMLDAEIADESREEDARGTDRRHHIRERRP